ncbi:MAG: C4-dicarboxylate ABC transporter, partial [Candidatus Omnitrophica bacterium]|nr:C4-dicarboxylate ABC transporter [Candidatus Omnitrophota bacterium]
MIDPGASNSNQRLSSIQDLHPAYFAMVMATGIVSISANLKGWVLLSYLLFWINVPAYLVLWILNLARIVCHPRKVLADLGNHARGVGFFTTIAATCVLGSQCVVLYQAHNVAFALCFFF